MNPSPSPEVIAAIINTQLDALDPKPTQWDKLCFAAQMIALVAITDIPWLNALAKEINARVYAMYDTHKATLVSAYADAKIEVANGDEQVPDSSTM